MTIRFSFAALAVAAAFPLSTPIHAAQEKVADAVVVTATRSARSVDETLAPVTVITREDIERQQAQSVAELLRGLPGISVANNGGRGKLTNVFLRGTESDHTLVLIDGIKVGSATAGTTAFQDLPIDLIERIEIVRGPRSSLYGSEAIGGVIQIFTKRGGGPALPFFSLGVGSDKTFKGTVGVSGGGEQTWYNASVSGEKTDGFNSCRVEAAGTGGCFTAEPDRDGYDNLSGSVRAGIRLDGGAELSLNWLRTEADSDFDGGFQNSSESMQEVIGGRFVVSPSAAWKLTLAAGQSKDESENFKDAVFASRFDTERSSYSVQNDVVVGDDGLLSFGLDYQDDRIASSAAYPVRARDNRGVFGLYQGRFGQHDYQLSLRNDDNEQFGTHNTGSLAWGMPLSDSLRVTASYGTAFKAPSFNELYFPLFGNPALEPERSRSLEVGLSGNEGWGSWSANVFQTTVDDLIAYDASLFLPNNIDSARIRGLEGVLATRLADWDLRSTLTLLAPENRSAGANHGKVLPRRAEQTLRVDADRSYGKYRAGMTLFAAGRRYDDIANSNRLGGYATVDLRAEYLIDKSWRLQGKVGNLFDKDFETARFYEQQGRNLFVTLIYQPER